MNSTQRLVGVLAAIVLLSAVCFRFVDLGLKPAHHDEAVNYAFTKKLVEKAEYRYNHTAYHGPFLYFVGVPAAALGGYSKTALRFTPALFGLLTVLLLLAMARWIGTPGALFAAALVAVGPADVYFSRTFIHEIYFAFAFAGTLWAMFAAGRTGRPLAVVAFYVFLAIAFTTKETAAFNAMAFTLALVVAWLADAYGRSDEPFAAGPLIGRPTFYPFIWAIGISVTLWLLLFTSFLTNPQGMLDFFKAYLPWFETGVKKATHVKAWTYFFELLATYYWPALPLAAFALVRAAQKRRPRSLALGVIALTLLAVYTIIPYKTPWCIVTIGLAFVVLAGDGFSDLWRLLPWPAARGLLAGVALAAVVVFGAYSYRLNFQEYDYNHNQYQNVRQYEIVYVQTLRGYEQLVADVAAVAEVSGRGKAMKIFVSAGSKNPARLYLHDYKRVKLARDVPEEPVRHDVVIVRSSEEKKYADKYDGPYHVFGTYPVFPGWNVNLMVRDKLWQKLIVAGVASKPNPS